MVIQVKHILIATTVHKKVGNWRHALFTNDWRDVFRTIVSNVLSTNKSSPNLSSGCALTPGTFLLLLYTKTKAESRVLLIGYLNKNID